jgi:hypothetical protein
VSVIVAAPASAALSSRLTSACPSARSATIARSSPSRSSKATLPGQPSTMPVRNRRSVVRSGASPVTSPAANRIPETIALQRITSACISSTSAASRGSRAIAASLFQSPSRTEIDDSGVPSSCAAPLASRPMRTI